MRGGLLRGLVGGRRGQIEIGWHPDVDGPPRTRLRRTAPGHLGAGIGAAVVAACVLLSGCGGGDDLPRATTTVTVTTSADPAPSSTQPALTYQEASELAFFRVLDDAGIPYRDRETALLEAQALCAWYEVTGRPFALGVLQIQRRNPHFVGTQAGAFAGAATAAFCEEYSPR